MAVYNSDGIQIDATEWKLRISGISFVMDDTVESVTPSFENSKSKLQRYYNLAAISTAANANPPFRW